MVSTVALELNHGGYGARKDLYYETMLFDGKDNLDDNIWRYSTQEEAEENHARLKTLIQEGKL